MHHQYYQHGRFLVSTDPTLLDITAIHDFLSHCYWAEGIPLKLVERSIQGSLCFGLYDGRAQVGFARVITDRATFAYMADVYVLEPYRGQGLGTWLVECIMGHPDLQGLRRWCLLTRDAHGLYRKFGFSSPKEPGKYMEISNADIYKQEQGVS
ncbi:MAG: family N-acetyltransferase [Bacteroidetes bacterium]|jgi:GNAT superfamily N-acetyltransferase|nr:family N-acetyltransferase [Bacteroidota bacterium]